MRVSQAILTSQPATGIDATWKTWIAENLILGTSPSLIVQTLIGHGITMADARAEVQAAIESPYLRGADRLRRRLTKRDWVLGIQRKLNHLRPASVERRHRLDTETFLAHYYSVNRPVVITGMLDDWAAMHKWSNEYFASRYGDTEVEVQFGRDADAEYEMNSAAHKRRIRFREYVGMIESCAAGNDFYMTANNDSINRKVLAGLWDDITQIPEYLDPGKPGGFFWFGPAGTVTPFHHDLTNNFMAQVRGRKRLRLIPACELPGMYNARHCFTPVDGRNIDYARFPDMADVQTLECEIGPGDLLFLPVGMWHFVEALDVSVTMTFTNFRWNNDFYSDYPEQRDF